MSQEDEDLVREFLLESRDNLDQLDIELVALEDEPTSESLLSSVFRTIHTIKGTAGFFGFKKLESVAHVGETLLSRLRDGVIRLNAERTTGLLAMVDAIRTLLLEIERTGTEGTGHFGAVIEGLSLLANDATAPSGHAVLAGSKEVAARRASAPPRPLSLRAGAAASKASAGPPPAREAPSPVAPPSDGEAPHLEERAVKSTALATKAQEEARPMSDPRIRVDVGLLDRLMNRVGELVLARNQLVQHAAESGDAALVTTCQRLNLITSELQEGVMKTRMQPIDNVWSKFPRIVRDLSLTCGKQINLEMEGKNTELDKTIIEAISDPLTHLVRNAADHGIETPEQRAAAGKRPIGTLKLRAFHEGGRVNIELIDDGRGIDTERVRAKAVEQGLLSSERARALSPQEAMNLIFLPGFSTAEQVTNVSGRGVGMDVVRSNIERIGGNVEIDSRLGHGTSIRIKIPLTLAIIPALVVTANKDRFAIPQVNLVELVRFDAEQARTAIEWLHGVPVFRLRGNLLALVELSHALKLGHKKREDFNIVVLQADERQFGLVVDGINDTQEIVVKPLTRELKGLNTYAGATIMGDGRVALILDVMGLAERAGVAASPPRVLGTDTDKLKEFERLILFRTSNGARMALPLRSVARLEEFAQSRVERVGDEEVVQYRGEILPLVYLSQTFGGAKVMNDPLQVVVHSDSSGSMGLVVDAIDDIVEDAVTVRRAGGRVGVSGTVVVQGRVTELLDLEVVKQRAARGRQ
jgi:two-component system, chemotaxis family, sensor kinase CheA